MIHYLHSKLDPNRKIQFNLCPNVTIFRQKLTFWKKNELFLFFSKAF
ncbi:hypothetical protein HOLDEFILI_03170 [Holdemania filiformis DSM 12042]|uniref:Uncharacterized protein n=1 Tax=Holdemania filiformis DSM 12042 TaxID=545696 RepID=B9YBG3_9FIRM|nr:hypothetical protein HOLDEFILI_03170 [Holdemania filiformis DSM 12042]